MEREVSEVDRKLLLKNKYLDKISYYLSRNPISQDELYIFVRKFFGEYLKLNYEFTYEELSQELNKVFIKPQVKETIDSFLIRLSESEYLEETILGTNELNSFLRELSKIITLMIYDDMPLKKEGSFIKKVLNINSKSQDTDITISSVSSEIENVNFVITGGDITLAKKSYIELLKKYDSLNKDDKKKLHMDMTELYDRLQIAIKNSSLSNAVSSNTISNSSNTISNNALSNQSPVKLSSDVLSSVSQVSQSSDSKSDAKQDLSNSKNAVTQVHDIIKKILTLIDETSYYITSSNISSAKNSYAEALKLYELVSFEEKKFLHPKISELYLKLQSHPISALSTSKNTSESYPEADSKIDSKSKTQFKTGSEAKSKSETKSKTVSWASADSSESEFDTTDSIDKNVDKNIKNVLQSDSNFSGSSDSNVPVLDFSNSDTNSNISSQISSSISSPDFLKQDVFDSKSSSDSENVLLISSSSTSPTDAESVKAEYAKEFTTKFKDESLIDKSKNDLIEKNNVVKSDIVKNDTLTSKKLTSKKDVKNVIDTKEIINNKTSVDIILPKFIPTTVPTITPASIPNNVPAIISNATTKTPDRVLSETLPTSQVSTASFMPVSESSTTSLASHVNISHPDTETSKISSMNERMNILLKKIEDDMILDKFEKAKESYDDALIIYNNMRNSEKILCYDRFHEIFKKLDLMLHKKSLTIILHEHLLPSSSSSLSSPSSKIILSDEKEKQYGSESTPAAQANTQTSMQMNIQTDIVPVGDKDSNVTKRKANNITPNMKSTTGSFNTKLQQNPFLELTNTQLDNKLLPVVTDNDDMVVRVYELIEESYFNISNNNFDIAMLKYFKALEFYRKLSPVDKKKTYGEIYHLFKSMCSVKK